MTMLYMEVDDSASASTAIQRGAPFLSRLSSHSHVTSHVTPESFSSSSSTPSSHSSPASLLLLYKSCYARILDRKRKFLEAATRYHEISRHSSPSSDGPHANANGGVVIDPESIQQALQSAAICAILAGAGEQVCNHVTYHHLTPDVNPNPNPNPLYMETLARSYDMTY